MRVRLRLFSLLSVVPLLMLGAVPATATSEGHGYLALGDSVSFGYSPVVDPTHIANFTGWPEIVAQRLNIEDANAACPGEATGGFLSLTSTDDNGCQPWRFVLHLPLHVEYAGTQMDFAVTYLRNNPRTRLVTLMIGANDAFHLQNVCAAANPDDKAAAAACVNAGLPGVLATIAQNLATIFATLRAAGYTGLIVALTYYALNYGDPVSVGESEALNSVMTAVAPNFGVLIASGFAAWQPVAEQFGGDSCAAGLLIRLTPTKCDVHPTPAGRDLLAAAVVKAIGDSCPASSPIGCLNRNQG